MGYNRYVYALNNPLKYVDPDGENPLLIAMLIGALINTGVQAISGNIHNFSDFALSMGIGALSGLAGFGAGQAVTGALSTATTLGGAFANGAAIGAASGFAGGFVGGAGNAWVGGTSFDQGLGQGLKAGGLGALAGGVIGGVTEGWNLVRAKSYYNNHINIKDDGVSLSGKNVDPTIDNIDIMTDTYFGGEQKGLVETKIGNVKGGAGKTTPIGNYKLGVSRNSNVTISLKAFRSRFALYNTLGHEYVHVAQFYQGLNPYSSFLEVGAYAWNQHVYGFSDKTTFPASYQKELTLNLNKVRIINQGCLKNGFAPLNLMDYMWHNLPTFQYVPLFH